MAEINTLGRPPGIRQTSSSEGKSNNKDIESYFTGQKLKTLPPGGSSLGLQLQLQYKGGQPIYRQ